MALDITVLRRLEPHIVCLGSYPGIVQSILDFDYLAGRPAPSITHIVAAGRKSERYFFGDREVVLPVVSHIDAIPASARQRLNLALNLAPGRRVLPLSLAALEALPQLVGGSVFAEGLPERQALELGAAARAHGRWIIGGASVGLVVPGVVKLGAIGGIQAQQLLAARLLTPGQVAVISSSGGMVNEIIRTLAAAGQPVSFALALGGERFPLLGPAEACLAAEHDPLTRTIVYFGELGGDDEYQLAELIRARHITKPIVAYIAGRVSELFAAPPQFGHAKALAAHVNESARAKTDALAAAGVQTAASYHEFVQQLQELSLSSSARAASSPADPPSLPASRQPALFASSIASLSQQLPAMAAEQSLAHIALTLWLGRPIVSGQLERFADLALRLLVDNGPYQSAAVNTMVTARAGRDLVSALTAGLLTIGPRFGGATGQAAAVWLQGVTSGQSAAALVEEYAATARRLPGIGHRHYRLDQPDPRVEQLLAFIADLPHRRFTTFAQAVAALTTAKKANLILNVDGALAAALLDLLSEAEGYGDQQLRELIDTEFFNAIFILSRSVGLMAHYFDQVRLDEGLFRLQSHQVAQLPTDPSVQ